jgi:hypothetical protein
LFIEIKHVRTLLRVPVISDSLILYLPEHKMSSLLSPSILWHLKKKTRVILHLHAQAYSAVSSLKVEVFMYVRAGK